MSAVRSGDQFDEESGLPVSELRAQRGSVTWYQHARDYVDRKWDLAPAKSRKSYAGALATITPALVKTRSGMPEQSALRRALYGWAFNRNRWTETPPKEIRDALAWIKRHSLPVSALEDPATLRQALDALGKRYPTRPVGVVADFAAVQQRLRRPVACPASRQVSAFP